MYGWQYPQYAISSYAGYGANYPHCPKADKHERKYQYRKDKYKSLGKYQYVQKLGWKEAYEYSERARDKALLKCDQKLGQAIYEETGEIATVKSGQLNFKPQLMQAGFDAFAQPSQKAVQIGQLRNGAAPSAPPPAYAPQQSGMGAMDTGGLGKLALSLALLGGTTFVFLKVAKKQGWIGQ